MEAIHYINKLNKAPEVLIIIIIIKVIYIHILILIILKVIIIFFAILVILKTKLVQKMQSDDSSAGSREIQENSSYPTGRFVQNKAFDVVKVQKGPKK